MKQLNKIQTSIFILGGVLMVIGAGCFAFGYMIYPQLTLYTSWLFLLGTVAFSVMQSMQLYEGSSQVVHRLKRIQAVADIFFVLSGISMVDTVYALPATGFQLRDLYHLFLQQVGGVSVGGSPHRIVHHTPYFA